MLTWAVILFQAMGEYDQNAANTNDDTKGKNIRLPIYGIIHKNEKKMIIRQPTVIQISNISDKILTQTTGFRSMASMLVFIFVVCNGDLDKVRNTTTTLTWIEEWYLYFERVYGRSVRRIVD